MDSGRLKVEGDNPPSFRRQGSIRKVLHSNENEPMFGVSAKMLDRGKTETLNSSSILSCVQSFQEYCIISEFKLLVDNLVPGIYMVPSAKSALLWFGVVFINEGPFSGGVFRFNLLLSETFPSSIPPRVIFESEVFHPHIDPDSKELDLKPNFPEWSKGANHMYQVAQYIKDIFWEIKRKNPVNKPASDLYDLNEEEFSKRAEECAKLSLDNLFKPSSCDDPHYITFSNYDENTHGPAKAVLVAQHIEEEVPETSGGLSWVKEGSLDTFSVSFLSEP